MQWHSAALSSGDEQQQLGNRALQHFTIAEKSFLADGDEKGAEGVKRLSEKLAEMIAAGDIRD